MPPIGAARGGIYGGVDAIPDSVVSRADDNDSGGTQSDKRGLQINPNSDFAAVGARISANTSNPTRAYLYDVSAGTIIDETDISGLSTGDAFSLDAAINQDQDYNILLDAEGSGYEVGAYTSGDSLPVSGTDIDIVDGIKSTNTSAAPQVVNDIGNPDNVLG